MNTYKEGDELVFLIYQPRKGWTPDHRFDVPKRDIITGEPVPVTAEMLAELKWLRAARFGFAITMVGVLAAGLFVWAVVWMLTL